MLQHISMSDEQREGKELFKQLDMAAYARKSFGKEASFIPADENHFTVNVDVHVSMQFLGWIISLGEKVKILGPEAVVEQMNGIIDRMICQYRE
jgi:hypothetical protein